MQHPIASILSLCVLAGVAATVISYSQAPNATMGGEVAPMTLPADNVELVDVNGRAITVTVLEKHLRGITIRNEQGGKTFVEWNKLSPQTVTKITGKAPQPNMAPQTREQGIADMKRAGELRKKFDQMSAKELMAAYKAGNEEIAFMLQRSERSFANWMKYHGNKKPSLSEQTRSGVALLNEVEIREGDEHVTLRPEFERVGVVAQGQGQTWTCFQHATYHMYQYECRRKRLKVPSYPQFMDMIGGGAGVLGRIHTIQASNGNQLFIQHLQLGIPVLERELVKHQIRIGHPCVMLMESHVSGAHGVLIIGFKLEGNTTTFEYLDSNGVAENKGYRTMDATRFIASSEGWSAWLK